MSDRHTRTPEEHLGDLPPLNDSEIADREARNGLLQFDLMHEMIAAVVAGDPLRLTPEHVCRLNEVAVRGLEASAGTFRQHGVQISGTPHVPPPHTEVPQLVQEMCDYVNRDGWTSEDAVHLAAYTMWRMNWIHPFTNGNGRTSRAVSYFVLSAMLGFQLPGKTTVPEMIAADKTSYYRALESADAAWKAGAMDVSAMATLLAALLMKQLTGTA